MWYNEIRIFRVMKEGFAQFNWRPRPPTLLSEKQQKDIKKNLKKYYSQFESKDRMRSSKASKVKYWLKIFAFSWFTVLYGSQVWQRMWDLY